MLACAALAAAACFSNATAVNVLQPVIARELQASGAQAPWIVLSYWLSMAVLTLCFGRLSDLWGRRQLFCLGLAAFAATGLAAALASAPAGLLLARTLQGVAAAAVFANTAVLVVDAHPGAQIGGALGRLALVAALAQALGPSVGAWIAQQLGWRSVFLASALLAAGVGLWGLRLLPRTAPAPRGEGFDGVGALLSVLLLGVVCAGLTGIGPALAPAWRLGATAGAGLALAVALGWWSQRVPAPLVDPALLRDKRIATLLAGIFLTGMAQQGPVVVLALYSQLVLQLPLAETGWRLGAFALGMVAGAPLATRSQRHWTAARVCLGALWAMGLASAALAALAWRWHAGLALLALCALGASVALFVTPCATLLMQWCPPGRRGIANALRAALQTAGGLVGAALLLGLATAGLPAGLQQQLYRSGPGLLTATDQAALGRGVACALATLGAMLLAAAAASTVQRRRPPKIAPPASG